MMSDSARKNYMYFFDMIMRVVRASSWVALSFRQAVVFLRSPNGPGTLVTKPQPAPAHLGKANLDTTVANAENLLRSRCPQISKSECRKQARGGGVHIGAVPGGQKIHQCGIFGFCNEPHVRGSSYMYSI